MAGAPAPVDAVLGGLPQQTQPPPMKRLPGKKSVKSAALDALVGSSAPPEKVVKMAMKAMKAMKAVKPAKKKAPSTLAADTSGGKKRKAAAISGSEKKTFKTVVFSFV